MDVNARTLSLWEHACCGDRYWSAARLCDRCGADAFAVLFSVPLADAMARMHFHARPATVPTPVPASTPAVDAPVPPVGDPPQAPALPVAARPVPATRRHPIREDELGPPVARSPTGQPSDPGVAFLLGISLAGMLVFLLTCMLMLI